MPIITGFKVEIWEKPGAAVLNEAGFNRLLDALADIDAAAVLNDALVDALDKAKLPAELRDCLEVHVT